MMFNFLPKENLQYFLNQIKNKLDLKVDKVSGKTLSTNDLTNSLKISYDDAVSKKHTHANKAVLDNTTASFTTEEKTKLSGIAAGAQANVQSDWNETTTSSVAFIKNKPTIPSATSQLKNDSDYTTSEFVTNALKSKVDIKEGWGLSENNLTAALITKINNADAKAHTHNNYATLENIEEAYTTAEKNKLKNIAAGAQVNSITGVKGDSETEYRTGNVNITKANVGLGNVDNTTDVNKPVSTAQQKAIDAAYANSNKYTDKKIADLINGAPETMDTLKEVSDAINASKSVEEALNKAIGTKANQTELDTHTGNDTIHITATERTNWNDANSKKHSHANKTTLDGITADKVASWDKISNKLNEDGNASNTTVAFEKATTRTNLTTGEKISISFGKIAKWFSDLKTVAFSGSYKDLSDTPTLGTAASKNVASSGNASTTQVVMGNDTRLTDSRKASDVYEWAKAANKPTYTKSEVGLGNVGNYKAVSTVASQGLTDTEKANARANIGAGTGNSNFSGAYADLSGKPTLGSAAAKDVPSSGNATNSQVVMGNDTRLTNARPASDVSAWAKAASKPTYTAAEVGALASSVTHLSGDIATSQKGAVNGVATLGSDGKVPSSQLPSYVDDVLEYASVSKFPTTGESGKIYVATDSSKTYRWSGTTYVEISPSIVVGTTTGTAFDGGVGNAHVNNKSNPHGVTASQIGLGNVGNFKAVSTAASQGLTDEEKANARANIGAGTGNSNFSGAYADLSGKPTIPSVGNGTVTITQNGISKGTFTMNQNGNTTIALTDTDTNTWRDVVDNLSSTRTDASLSANQGRILSAKLPFALGIDADGNYGYYKAGADTVTPFKTGDKIINSRFPNGKSLVGLDSFVLTSNGKTYNQGSTITISENTTKIGDNKVPNGSIRIYNKGGKGVSGMAFTPDYIDLTDINFIFTSSVYADIGSSSHTGFQMKLTIVDENGNGTELATTELGFSNTIKQGNLCANVYGYSGKYKIGYRAAFPESGYVDIFYFGLY